MTGTFDMDAAERPEPAVAAGSDRRDAALARALELRASGRADWLEAAVEGDEALREEVKALVASADVVGSLVRTGYGSRSRDGDVLGERYQLGEPLGSGAMGVVYMAHDRDLQRDVAVKILNAGLVHPVRAESRFDREARALASVDHRSVVAIHDRGRTPDGEDFLVMDLVRGGSLSELVHGFRHSSATALDADVSEALAARGASLDAPATYVRWAVQAAADLAAGAAQAHAAGVIHRDIKPTNVLIGEDGRCVLIDFGIARLADGADLTRGGSSIGTPSFMAPECAASGKRATVASDVYGICALLYYLLAFRPPYEGTPIEVLAKLGKRDPVPIHRLAPGLPRDLVAVIEKGMSRAPGGRYRDAAALERDLRAFLGHQAVGARAVHPLRRQSRRVWRSAVGRTLLVVFGLLLLASMARVGHASWTRHRHEAYLQLFQQLPPHFTMVDFSKRRVLDPEDREELSQLLDDLVVAAVDPLLPLLLRSSFRLDHADVDGAAEDMATLAQREGTGYAEALAQAYAEARDGTSDSREIDRTTLPAPKTQRSRAIAAYHHARDYEDRDALALIDGQMLREIPWTFEIQVLATPLGGLPSRERRARSVVLFEELVEYEGRVGCPTAWICHWQATALGFLGRYPDAYRVEMASIALAPRFHVSRVSAGYYAFTMSQMDDAREHMWMAHALQPKRLKTANELYLYAVREGRFDHALDVIARCESAFAGAHPGWAQCAMGAVEVYRALWLSRSSVGDEVSLLAAAEGPEGAADTSARALTKAREHFEATRVPGSAHSPSSRILELADALERGGSEDVFHALATQYARDPRAWWRLELLGLHVPPESDPNGDVSLTLRSVAVEMSLTPLVGRDR